MALGEIGEKSAISALILQLGREEYGGGIEQTSLALQRLQATEAVPALRKVLSHTADRTKNWANPTQTRCWLLQAIGHLGSKADLPLLAKYLYDPDTSICYCAARDIGVMTGEDFGFPKQGGFTYLSRPVQAARQWWEKNKLRFQ